jgi:hypothetical protein
MKRFGFTFGASLLILLMLALIPALSQDEMEGEDGPPEDPWAKLNEPGDEHKKLALDAGEWDIAAKMWMEGAEEPVETKGRATLKMVYDRYLYEEFSLGEGEQAFHGFGYIGYDNSNQEFVAMYCGNNQTGMQLLRGTSDKEGKTVTLKGEWVEKGLGDMKMKQRVEVTAVNADKTVTTIYMTMGDAPEAKIMEMTYTRRK